MKKEFLLTIIALFTIVGFAFGAYYKLRGEFYSAKDAGALEKYVMKVDDKIDQEIISNKIDRIQGRQWILKERYGENLKGGDITVKEEFQRLEQDKLKLEKELEKEGGNN